MSPMPKQTCLRQRCKHRVWLAGLCRTHAKREADRLFSEFIKERDRICMATTDFWLGAQFDCVTFQGLHCAHLRRRGYLAIRWDPRNAVALCAGHHKWFDDNTIEKEDMRLQYWGRRRYNAIKKKALEGDWRPELERVLTKGFAPATPR